MNVSHHGGAGRVVRLALVLAALCALVATASAATVTVTTGTYNIASVGGTVQVPINLDLGSATTGLAGYKLIVTLSNPTAAEITDVTFPSWAVVNNKTALVLPSQSVIISGVDLMQQVPAGSSTVLLATLTVKGKANGDSNIVIVPEAGQGVQEESGTKYTVNAPVGKVHVGPTTTTTIPTTTITTVATSPTPTINDTPTVTMTTTVTTTATTTTTTTATTTTTTPPATDVTVMTGDVSIAAVGDTKDVPIILNSAPEGLAGYKLTVKLPNATVAQVTDVTFPSWAVVNNKTNLTFPSNELILSGVDLMQQVSPGATNVVLANLTVKGLANGVTPIEITPYPGIGVQKESGSQYAVATPPGSVTVGPNVTPTTPTPTPTTPTPTPTPVINGTEPYPGAHVLPVKIEAEHFDKGGEGLAYHDVEPQNLGNNNMRAGEGVDIETDAGVTNVAYVRAGEYLVYSVDANAAGKFALTLRASNPDSTAKAVKVYLDGVPAGEVLVGGTGGWTTYKDFVGTQVLQVPTGRHTVKLAFEGINRINLDYLRLDSAETQLEDTVPYGPGNNIPGRVQAENFDKSGSDPAYYDTTSANEGGAYRTTEPVDIEYTSGEASYNIGWIRTNEWLLYTVQVSSGGSYTASFRAANPDAVSKPIDVYLDGVKIGSVQIGTTGSFGTFKTFTSTFTLPAGKHQIKLFFPAERINLNYIDFANGGVVTTTTTTTPQPGGASFVAVPTTAPYGSAVKFTVTPSPGKTISAAWWSFDAPAHLNTWNSRAVNPTFFYPQRGTFSPLVRLTYTDGSTEEVQRVNYIKAT